MTLPQYPINHQWESAQADPQRKPRRQGAPRGEREEPTIPRRIAFINEKGGSGKTTLVANIATYLAMRRGRRTLAIDMDPQGQLGKVLGLDVRSSRRSSIELLVESLLGENTPGHEDSPTGEGSPVEPRPAALPTVATRIPTLDVIVSNKALALFPAWTGGGGANTTQRLSQALRRAPNLDIYDFVLVDAPPSFGPLTLNILCACDEIVVPVPLTFLALDGCAELMRTVAIVRERYGNPGLSVTMVIPTFYRRTKLAGEILENLKQRFPKEIAQTVVGYHVKIDEAQSRGLSIFEYAPSGSGARAMAALAEELDARGLPATVYPEPSSPTPSSPTRAEP